MVTTVKKTTKPAAKKAAPKTKKTIAAKKVAAIAAEVMEKKTKTTKKTTAAKTTAEKKTTAKKTAAKTANKSLCIDYPQANDTIYCGHYCFRLGSKDIADWVKVSINEGPWVDCRTANGYWWCDWWNFETGTYVIEAAALINGKEEKTAKRKFKVVL